MSNFNGGYQPKPFNGPQPKPPTSGSNIQILKCEPKNESKPRTYVIPTNPTAAELQTALIDIANNMSKTADLIGQYKKAVADATTKYKRAYARALVNNQGAKNMAMQKALADIDDLVIATQDEVDKATATYTLAMGEYEGMETQFVALRKVVEIQKLEYKGEYGNGL